MFVYYKYEVQPEARWSLQLPNSASIMSVQMQRGYAVMWALVDLADAEPVTRHFGTIPTGQPFECGADEDIEHIGTFQPDPNLVFHLIEFTKFDEEEESDEEDDEDEEESH